jgi:hypothetical protein
MTAEENGLNSEGLMTAQLPVAIAYTTGFKFT